MKENDNIREHWNIKVSGRLQDFDFIYYSVLYANTFDILGYVKQIDEETIRIEAEGAKYNLEKFIDLFRDGSLSSFTNYVNVEMGLLGDYRKFVVLKYKAKEFNFLSIPVFSKFSLSFRNFLH
ncbi:MAG: acylphosphatase [Saprospiraceae bacterium]|nr:acylphosphatase [Saprospiraceae bacterium]